MAGKKDRDLDFAVPGLDEEELGSIDQYRMDQDQLGQDQMDLLDQIGQDQLDRDQMNQYRSGQGKMHQEPVQSAKEISLFWLLQHYSRENAAAYKQQQSRKKEEKQGRKPGRTGKKSKTEKKIREVPAAPVPSSAAKKQPGPEEKYRIREEDDFGATVYVNRDSGQEMAGQALHVKAALECPGYGQTVPVDKLPFMIGRSSNGVDLCIADNRTVGRMHAVISCRNGVFYIKDLNSLNHVFLNGRQIPPERDVVLKNRTKITLGNEELIFHCTNK